MAFAIAAPAFGTDSQSDIYDDVGTIAGTVGELPDSGDISFYDVTENDWFYDAVMNAVAIGLFQGTSDYTFEPGMSMTRAMLAQVLANLGNVDLTEFQDAEASFTDVPVDAWYFPAVEWAAEFRIIEGAEGNFSPERNVSRQEMAAMLFRYANVHNVPLPDGEATNFRDQELIAFWAEVEVAVISAAGIIQGRPDGSFDPRSPVTRAEGATVFMRFLDILNPITTYDTHNDIYPNS